jgi:glutaredoxin 3
MAQIEIFTGPRCSYCARAKALLEAKGCAFTEFDISADASHHAAFRERLPRAKSIPQIFIDGAHIGGFEDLEIWATDGRLDQLLD